MSSVLSVVLSLVAVATAQTNPVTVTTTTYTDLPNGAVYPQSPSSTNYFNNRMDFNTIANRILIGARDQLHLLDYSLNTIDTYSWPSFSCDSENSDYECRNYIRVYDEIPGGVNGSRALLVCGTFSLQPQCRTLLITSDGLFGSPGGSSSDVQGIISPHPDLPDFGEFRKSTEDDLTYFTASFTRPNTISFDMAYVDINVNTETRSPLPQRQYGIVPTRSAWLNSPVVFVDFRRENYPRPATTTDDAAFQFYFVFLRENFQVDNREVIYSRVVRICRNDGGAPSSQDPGSQIFSTYLKARIFCFREMPPGNQFVGAQDFEYNEIWSVSFNSEAGGRYHAAGDYNRLMYGAFSGPLIGPRGSAICVYPAYPNAADENGIFDVFLGDLLISNQTGANNERQNNFADCSAQGQSMRGDPEDIQIIKDISQLGKNPLVILDGVHVTQMLVDEVCVVRSDTLTQCVNQDVFWLGTNNGLVYKVVITSDMTPLIVDEITLDDMSSVRGMRMEVVESTKRLFVSTETRVYRLPLENCARFGSNFMECIASRDPYCVWESEDVSCIRSTLSAQGEAVGNISPSVRQNIHTGIDTVPVVSFTSEAYTVLEDQGQLMVTITSDSRVSDGVLQLVLIDGSARGGVNFAPRTNPIVNFPVNSNTVTVAIDIMDSPDVFSGNLEFTMSLRSSGSGALTIANNDLTVTIVDQQALYFQLTLGGLRHPTTNEQQSCNNWRLFEPNNKISAITDAILTRLGALKADSEDNSDVFPESTFLCANKLSSDKQEFVVFRSILDLSKIIAPISSRTYVLDSISEWVSKTPLIVNGLMVYSVLYDTSCSLEITSLAEPLCEYNGITVGDTGAVVSSSDAGTVTALGVLLALSVVLSLVVVVTVFSYRLYRRKNRCYHPNTVGVNKKDNGQLEMAQGNGEGHDSPPNTAAQLVHFQFPSDSLGNEHTAIPEKPT